MNMKEILFRAKRIDNGEWVEGYYGIKGKGTDIENHYIMVPTFQSGIGNYDYMCYFTDVHIDSETLCQYTGLKDKNGNRIWENDIVSCEHEKFQEGDAVEQYPFPDTIRYKRNYAVEFINTGSNYGYRLRNKSIHFVLTGNVIYNHKIEVIGNVFDNLELLKGDSV